MSEEDRTARAQALKQFMEERGLRAHPWARKAGLRSSTIYNLMSGRSASLSADVMERLASAAGVTVDELLGRARAPSTTETRSRHEIIVRYVVGTSGRLFVNEKEGQERVQRPAGVAESVALIAARIDGDGLAPLRAGWIVYIEAEPSPPERLIGKLAMVTVPGKTEPLIREIRRGSSAGLYTLLAWHGSPLEDVEVTEARLVASLAQP